MDQRLIDANDPTSFGGDIIKANEKKKQEDYYMPGDEEIERKGGS